jgi:hypothetical protein
MSTRGQGTGADFILFGESNVTRGPRAGTRDSTDLIYERSGYELPVSLAAGDFVDFLSAGAYTVSYASVAFDSFTPLRAYCI